MLQLNFKKLILHNFGSYADTTIELENKGFCLVIGQNNCSKDNALSNGAGKSFLWSAICFALTGETIQGVRSNLKNINIPDDKEMYVELYFSVGSDDYVIKRGQVNSKYISITKNGVNVSGKTFTESTDKLQDLFPDITRKLIASSIIVGQGMPFRFSSQSPADRKGLLEELTKSDFMIEDIKNRVTDRLDFLNRKLREYDDSLLVNKTQLNTVTTNLTTAQNELNNAVRPDFDAEIKKVEAQMAAIKKDIDNADSEIKKYTKANNDTNTLLLESVKAKAEESTEELNAYNTARSGFISQKASLETQIRTLEKEIKRLKDIKDVCPYCGQKLQGVEKPHTEVHEKELKEAKDQLPEIEKQLTTFAEKHQKYLEDIKNKYDSKISSLNETITNNKKTISKYTDDFNDYSHYYELEKEKLGKLNYDKDNWDKYYANLKTKIDSLLKEQADITKAITLIENAQLDITARIENDRKIDTVIKRDFRGYLLIHIINYIDQKAKEYSDIVFGTKELKIYLDGNALDVSYCGKMLDNLSGGEKTRVDLIIQLAIRNMLQKYLNFNSNILVLDEITDFLDKQSCKAVMTLLEKELTTIESVFVISHHADELELPIDSELKIIKNEDGISEAFQ